MWESAHTQSPRRQLRPRVLRAPLAGRDRRVHKELREPRGRPAPLGRLRRHHSLRVALSSQCRTLRSGSPHSQDRMSGREGPLERRRAGLCPRRPSRSKRRAPIVVPGEHDTVADSCHCHRAARDGRVNDDEALRRLRTSISRQCNNDAHDLNVRRVALSARDSS